MIKPTVGRVVWFWPSAAEFLNNDQPQAAQVAYVHSDRMVNLSVVNHNGEQRAQTSVALVQDGDKLPEQGSFCSWMPYQVGQAKKHEHADAVAGAMTGNAEGGVNKV